MKSNQILLSRAITCGLVLVASISLGFARPQKAETNTTLAKSTGAPPATPTPQPTPLGVQDHDVEGVEVALLSVERNSDSTVSIKWGYRNKTNVAKPLPSSAGMNGYRFAEGANFQDPSGQKYTVLKDKENLPVAAYHSQFVFDISLAPKQSVTTWAKFSAPPTTVEKITVNLPGAPPFEDIPMASISLGFAPPQKAETNTTPAKSTSAPPAAAPTPEPTPLGVQDHDVEGVEVALLSVKRNSDSTVTIKWGYRNKTNVAKPLAHGSSAGMDSYRFSEGANFQDPSGQKYTVLKDKDNLPVAANQVQFQFSISLAPKQSVTTWAKFSAPPTTVEKITVNLPGAPPFEDIPIGP